MAIQYDNILRIIDIHSKQISPETLQYINEQKITYQDQVMKEHIYNITDMIEEGLETDNKVIEKEMEQMHRLCIKHKAGYVRIIYT